MARYEMPVVVESTGEEQAITAVKEMIDQQIQKLKGKVISVDEWGEKSLAYEIQKHDRGYFLVYQVELPGTAVKKLKKLLSQDKRVLRLLVLNCI